MDKNEPADLEKDGVGNRNICNSIMQDHNIWDMTGNQEEEQYVENIQTYGDRPVEDESQVMWTDGIWILVLFI